MVLKHKYNGSFVTSAVELASEKGISTTGQLMQPDIIEVIVDDPSGSLDFVGYKPWEIIEDTAPSGRQDVWVGYVAAQRISREGDGVMFPTGRAWHLELRESNTLAARRLIRTTETPSRPAETVSTRLAWLMATDGWSLIEDYGHIATSSVALEEANLLNRYGIDVVQELCLRSGFNAYIRRHEATSDYEQFFYNDLLSTWDTGHISLSNDPSDIDVAADGTGTCFPLSADAVLTRDPSRIASLVAVPTSDDTVYASSPSTEAAFADVDQLAPDADITDSTKAQALADHLLGQHDAQEESLETVVRLPAAQVNDVYAGQRIYVRATHLPGLWATGQWCRVKQRSVSRPTSLTQAFYDVRLILNPMIAPTDSSAQLQSPQSSQYVDGGLFDVHWDHDGDDPGSGCSGSALDGLIAYGGSAGERTGLVMNGSGRVAIHTHGTLSGSTTGGSTTFTVYIYRGDSEELAQETYTDGIGGTHALSWTWDLDVNADVNEGDVIKVKFSVSPTPAIFVIPAGVGDCANMLTVTGGLAA